MAALVSLCAAGALAPAVADGRGKLPRATASATAGAGDLQISGDASVSNPDAFHGALVWSRLAAAAPAAGAPSRYRLAVRTSGVTSDLRVGDSTEQFNPEIGPGPRGAAVIVYDRCSTYDVRRGPSGCAMYIYSLRSAAERRIATRPPRGCRDEAPSVWGKNIIFARVAARSTPTGSTCPARRSGLYVVTGNRVRVVRHGAVNNGGCQGCGADLRGNVVASNASAAGLDDRLRIDFLNRRGGFLLYRDESNAFGGQGGAASPELTGRYLYWQATQGGEHGHEDLIYRAPVAVGAPCDTDPRRFQSPDRAANGSPGAQLNGLAVDGATLYYARSAFMGGPPGGLFQATAPPPAFSPGHGFWANRTPPLGRECGNYLR